MKKTSTFRSVSPLTLTLALGCGAPQPAESPAPAQGAASDATAAAAPGAPAAPAAAPDTAPPAAAGPDLVSIVLTNPLGVRRRETFALAVAELGKLAVGFDPKKTLVVDVRGKEVLSQLVDLDGDEAPDQLAFQAELEAGATQTFKLRGGERKPAAREEYRVYGRFVRERHDDFAWENDLVAHRMYGPALETWKKDPLVSSGIDTWSKRVPKLVVNDWYLTGDYHADHGEGADFYSVKQTRGCGGVGIWSGGKLFVSKNFTSSRVLASGPIRLVFELTYAPWEAGGRVSEVKRVTLDAGTPFNHFESTFTANRALNVAIGIAKHAGATVHADPAGTSLTTWEPVGENGGGGNLGCSIVLGPGARGEAQPSDPQNHLLIAAAKPKEPLSYHVGSAWDRAGRVRDLAGWVAESQALSARLAAPVAVKLTSLVAAAPAQPVPTPPAPAKPTLGSPGGAPAASAAPAKPVPSTPAAPPKPVMTAKPAPAPAGATTTPAPAPAASMETKAPAPAKPPLGTSTKP